MGDWIDLTVQQDGQDEVLVPVNMDMIVSYYSITDENPTFPNARTVLYPCGGAIQTFPVRETMGEIKKMMKENK